MPSALAASVKPVVEHQDYADKVIAAYQNRPGALLSILERVQDHHPHKYLPEDILEYVAQKLDIPLARIYSVVTFYSLFNLEPQGKHKICVCRGTACHTRGSRNLLDRLKLELGVQDSGEDGEGGHLAATTPDRKYSLRTVACFGQCALAPVVEVNHTIYGHMNEQALLREVEALEKGSRK
jgi:NADH-quinone oxidoreductase subunit E